LKLATQEQYSPTEILGLGLLDPASPITPARYISCEKLLPIQHRLNPDAHRHLTEDKVDFYRKCLADRLPTPRIIGIFGERGETHRELPVIGSAADVMAATQGLTGVVFKPLNGTHGDGVLVLDKVDDRFVDPTRKHLTSSDLLAHAHRVGYRTWLLQERLLPHPELVRLSGQPLIQTIRLVTFVEPSGEVSILRAWLRVVGGTTGADNFDFGHSGNFVGSIDLESGTIDHALARASNGVGLTRIATHPATGVRFDGYQIPEFAAACEIVRRAAMAFLPLRTIGWDAAVTDQGISLIEGNVTWDPLPTCFDLAAIARRLAQS